MSQRLLEESEPNINSSSLFPPTLGFTEPETQTRTPPPPPHPGAVPAPQKYDKTLEAMLPLSMLLLLLFLPVLIKLGNPLSRQKKGARCFIIKEERDTPANVAPVNEKYSGVLQDLKISITWHPLHPSARGIIQQPPPHLVALFLFCLLAEQTMGAV